MHLMDDLKAAHPLELVFRLMISAIGLLLLGFSAWMAASNFIVIATYEKAYAEVVSSQRTGPTSAKGLDNFHVRVKFEATGRTRQIELGKSFRSYALGDVIPVYYKPGAAFGAVAGDLWGMWFHVLVIAAPGLIMLYFGLKPDRKMKSR